MLRHFSILIFPRQPKDSNIFNKISSEHPLRFLEKSIKPFKSYFLHPPRCSAHFTGDKINTSTHCNGNRYLVRILILGYKFFLFRAAKKNNQNICTRQSNSIICRLKQAFVFSKPNGGEYESTIFNVGYFVRIFLAAFSSTSSLPPKEKFCILFHQQGHRYAIRNLSYILFL